MIGVCELMLSGCYRIWKGKAYFIDQSSTISIKLLP
jgi:hypothetical protein